MDTEEKVDQEKVDELTKDLGNIFNVDKPEDKKDPPVEDKEEAPPEDNKEDEEEKKEEKPEEKQEENENEFSLDDLDLDVPEDKEEEKTVEPSDEKTRQALISMRQENKTLKAQIAELQQNPPEDTEAIKAQLKEAHDLIGRISLENHPTFKEKYDRPINLLVNQAKTVLKELELSEEIADKAVNMSVVDRINYLNSEAPDVAHALTPLYTQLDIHRNARADELANHQATLEEVQANEMQKHTQQVSQFKAQHFNSAIEELQAEGHIAFVKTDNAKHNAKVDKIISVAQQIFNSDDPAIQSKYLLQGIEVPIYRQILAKEREYSKSLESELAKLGKARPRITSRGSDKSDKKADKHKAMSGADVASRVSPFK